MDKGSGAYVLSDVADGLRRVVLDCADLRLNIIVRQVRKYLAHRAAAGAYGVEEHQTAWDEYRYEVEEGPTPLLDSAWDIDLEQIINPHIGDLAHAEAILCSVAMSFMRDGDQTGLMEDPAVDKDAIVWGVKMQLRAMADGENFRTS